MSKTATDILTEFYAAYAKHDYDGMMAVLGDDVVWYVSESLPYGGRVAGSENVLAYFKALPQYVEQGSMDGLQMLDSGDHVVVTGLWSSRANTGVPFQSKFANIYEIHDGKIVSVDTFSDSATILKAFERG
jgi:ketosteroid isomerase-like protein